MKITKERELHQLCAEFVESLGIDEASELTADLVQAVLRLAADKPGRADLKLVLRAIKELRFGFKMFQPYRQRRKVSIFGSARTLADNADYQAAVEFGRLISAAGFMVITGAGGGIMQAGHEGAGLAHSFGVAIKLPFEQETNAIIAGDEKLAHFRYFFSRKIMFVKETNAVALFPGGFGTHDEAFEVLTLVQTGRADPMPIVMLEKPGGTYWSQWQTFVKHALADNGFISPEDSNLYFITQDPAQAAAHINQFYANYQSMRYVDDKTVLRVKYTPDAAALYRLNQQFSDICIQGPITIATAAEAEPAHAPEPHLPRLVLPFNRRSPARLRMLIDEINRLEPPTA
ncbi:MAG: LOG family protein [Phycisphaerae bacterium]